MFRIHERWRTYCLADGVLASQQRLFYAEDVILHAVHDAEPINIQGDRLSCHFFFSPPKKILLVACHMVYVVVAALSANCRTQNGKCDGN